MTRLIRNYQAGSQIVLSEHLRHHMADRGDMPISAAELARLRHEQDGNTAEDDVADLATAQEQAAALLRQAHEEIVVLQAEAQAQGFAEGYAQGIAEGQATGEQSLSASIQKTQAILVSIQRERTHLLLDAEHEVANLAMAIAEKIVGFLARTNKSLIVQTVNRALNEVAISGPFALRVHPDDATYLADHWQGTDNDGDAYAWKLIPDAEIEQGGCILVNGPASVDARRSSQLKAVVNGLALTDYRLDNELDESEIDQAQSEATSV